MSELYSPEGLRMDGRRWNELRSFQCKVNTHPNSSDGSSYVEQGNTKVICLVSGPKERSGNSSSSSSSNEAAISVNLIVGAFSTMERRKRSKNDKRIKEMVKLVEDSFSSTIMVDLYPATEIQVNCYVLSQDGGMLAGVMNSVNLAIIDAGISMYDSISCSSVGLFNNAINLLDLNEMEERELSCLTLTIIGKSENVSSLFLEEKIPFDRLQGLMEVGIAGCHRIKDLMDEELRSHGKKFIERSVNNN